MTAEKTIKAIGWVATMMAVAMYISYTDQIVRNLHGHKGSILQPAIACINCSLWTLYGLMKSPRDWPIIIANLPGVALGATAALTGF